MSKRRAYRRTAVKKVVLEKVLESAPAGDVYVGMDVGKGEIVTVVRWAEETILPNWGPAPRPPGFIALVPIPKVKEGGRKSRPPTFGLGPWDGARVGSHRCPILRPVRVNHSTHFEIQYKGALPLPLDLSGNRGCPATFPVPCAPARSAQ